jgi:hypothetical protein
MSFPAQVWLDAGRSLVVAGAATWAGWQLGGRLPTRLGWRWLPLVAPLVTPTLCVGQAYASLAARAAVSPLLTTAFYSLLLALKFLPLAALARRFFPPPLSAEARFSAQLAAVPRRFMLRASGPVPWAVALVVFLLVFTELELASLLSADTWTTTLFAAHHRGSALTESVARVLQPLALSLAAALGLALCGRRIAPHGESSEAVCKAPWLSDVTLLAAASLSSLAPLAIIAGQALARPGPLGLADVLGEDVFVSLAVATAATGATWLLAGYARRRSPALAFAAILPGLLGALGLALLLVAGLHAPPLDWFPPRLRARWIRAFDFVTRSPLPLLLGEIFLLAPAAFALRHALAARRLGESQHLARMAGSRCLLWSLALRPRAAVFAVLFTLAYTEFAAATILAPPHLTPVFVRLHQLASHGQTATLSALLLAALAAPAVLLALTCAAARFYARRDVR